MDTQSINKTVRESIAETLNQLPDSIHMAAHIDEFLDESEIRGVILSLEQKLDVDFDHDYISGLSTGEEIAKYILDVHYTTGGV